MNAEFKTTLHNEPGFNGVNYLVIISHLSTYSYAFRFWDGEKWEEKEGESVVAFSESDPIKIIKYIRTIPPTPPHVFYDINGEEI